MRLRHLGVGLPLTETSSAVLSHTQFLSKSNVLCKSGNHIHGTPHSGSSWLVALMLVAEWR